MQYVGSFAPVKMSAFAITIIIMLVSFGWSLQESSYTPRPCTRNDICLPVPADVCDNSKCLLVDISDVNDIVGSGAVPYKWNTALAEFNGSCPYKLSYEASSDCTDSKIDRVFKFYSGPSCNVSRTVMASAEGDTDPHTGQMRILKQKQAGDTYEVCFLYVELGVAHVYRKCLVDNGTLPCGKACGEISRCFRKPPAIYVARNTREFYASSKLEEFINQLGVDFPKISVECQFT